MKKMLLLLLLGAPAALSAQSPLLSFYHDGSQRSVAADFDNDGDVDIFAYRYKPCLLRNNGDTALVRIFPPSNVFTVRQYSSVDVADFGGDGIPDILITGETFGGLATQILRFQAGAFVVQDISADVPGVSDCQLKWLDYDRDGDLDIFLAGRRGSVWATQLYEWENGKYALSLNTFHQFPYPKFVFLDMEKDGDQDLVLVGGQPSGNLTRIAYRNTNNLYFPFDSTTVGNISGELLAGDLTGDGIPEIATAQTENKSNGFSWDIVRIYQYNGAGYAQIAEVRDTVVNSPNLHFFADMYLVDIDNNGRRDIVYGDSLRWISNEAGGFKLMPNIPTGAGRPPAVALADFTGDGKLDYVFKKTDGFWTTERFEVLANAFPAASQPPSAPGNLSAVAQNGMIRFSWQNGSDDHTPSSTLRYNARIGTAPGLGDVVGCDSDGTGRRLAFTPGNVPSGTSFSIFNLPQGNYWFSVQTIDGHHLGSPFATIPFAVGQVLAPPQLLSPAFKTAQQPLRTGFQWTPAPNAQVYHLQIATDPAFANLVYEDTELPATFDTITVPDCQTTYYWRVRGVATGYMGYWSKVFYFSTCPIFSSLDTLGLPAGYNAEQLKFVDLDNDLDPDLAVLMAKPAGTGVVQYSIGLFENQDGTFTYYFRTDSVNQLITNDTEQALMSWVDQDRDGDYDCFLSGFWDRNTLYYRNQGGQLLRTPAGDFPETRGELAWFDANNDNYADALHPEQCGTALRLRKTTGGYTELPLDFNNCYDARIQPLDFDNNGAQDVYVTGGVVYAALGRNTGQLQFPVVSGAPFVWAANGDTEIADVDGDGDMDLLVTGYSQGSTWGVWLYRNNNGVFAAPQSIGGPRTTEAAFSDFDLDGDPDLLLAGWFDPNRILRNTDGQFSLFFTLPYQNDQLFCADFADFDNDGDEDLAFGAAGAQVLLYVNNEGKSIYDYPFQGDAPGMLDVSIAGNDVTFYYQADFERGESFNSAATTYNLRVGKTPGGTEVVSPLADPASGKKYLPGPGNAGARESSTLRSLPPGAYYWSVQSVSPGLLASPFAAERSFTITTTGVEAAAGQAPGIRALPNPAAAETTVQLPEDVSGEFLLQVFDLHGKLLVSETLPPGASERHLDLSAWPPGVYAIQLRATYGKTWWGRVVKQ